MILTKFTKEQVDFLKGMSHQINDGENNWYYSPFWFKQIDDDKFEVTKFEKLPENVINLINDIKL
jgi:hypothetical protein